MEPQGTISEQDLAINAVRDSLAAPEGQSTTESSDAVTSYKDRSIFHSKLFVEEGDVVILHQTRENMLAVKVVRGEFHHSKYGRYAHDDMIGTRYGSRLASSPPHPGYIHLLRPTPALWSLSLPHRTQIVYLPDISFIMNELRVRTGSRVIEAGTGSGSMSHSLAMTIRKPGAERTAKRSSDSSEGKLFTFEYHATRYEKAREEFEEHGLDDVVQLRHRNVCKDGFGEEPSHVDAVFLDLPAPWDAIPHAIKHLRSDMSTRICCFSPCIEQVTRTVQALDMHGFTHIEMFEVLLRPYEMAQGQPPLRTVNSIANRLKKQEVFKEERRKVQMASARRRNQRLREEKEKAANPDALTTIDGDDTAGTVAGEKRGREGGDEATAQAVKKQKLGPNQAKVTGKSDQTDGDGAQGEPIEEEEEEEDAWRTRPMDWTTRVIAEVRGHTSYLTFATMFPTQVRADIAAREEEKKQRVLVKTAELAGIPKEGATAVALRAMAAAGAAGQSTNGTSNTSTGPGDTVNAILPAPQRSMTREDSFDTQMDDGFDNAIASMTDAELLALTPHKP